MTGASKGIRNRIVSTGEEAPDQLVANPRNWRVHPRHQEAALAAVLDEVGWVQQVIVNRSTGYVVDGHLRVALAISREEKSVPVVYVDLTPEEEALILATLDPLAGLAKGSAEILDGLLEEVTGMAGDEVDRLLADTRASLGSVAEDTVTERKASREQMDGFTLFHAIVRKQSLVQDTPYLFSFCQWGKKKKGVGVPQRCKVFADSGGFTGLKAEGRAYLDRQEEHVAWAVGLGADVIAMMDCPTSPAVLEGGGLSIKEAQEITHRNAVEFAKMDTEGIAKLFAIQGGTPASYKKAAKKMKPLVKGDDWIGIGGLAHRAAQVGPVLETYQAVREVFPERHIHMDYREMGRFKEWVDGTLDHRCLNDVWENPTAENMARAMFLLVQGWGWPVAWLEVSETPKTVARYHPKE